VQWHANHRQTLHVIMLIEFWSEEHGQFIDHPLRKLEGHVKCTEQLVTDGIIRKGNNCPYTCYNA